MPRGGYREGAGAPKGNLNALHHGRNSAQLRALLLLLNSPHVRALIKRLLEQQERRKRRAREDAAVFVWLKHFSAESLSPTTGLPPLTSRQTQLFAEAVITLLEEDQARARNAR